MSCNGAASPSFGALLPPRFLSNWRGGTKPSARSLPSPLALSALLVVWASASETRSPRIIGLYSVWAQLESPCGHAAESI
jgi:hypothetical protein